MKSNNNNNNNPSHNNNVIASSSNIEVAVRKRPLIQRELDLSGNAEIVEVDTSSKHIYLLDLDDVCRDHQLSININKNRFKPAQYTFDHVFDQYSSNSQVYSQLCLPFLSELLDGFNSTIFAYGATGSGKTYTMVGYKDQSGLMDMIVEGLFERIQQKQITHEVIIRVSYMEIHNENLRDLLSPESKNLELREDPKTDTTQVYGLTEIEVVEPQQVHGLLKIGSKNRAKDQTASNEASSRSHGILQISIMCTEKAEGLETESVLSKLSLVDLAGSEKAWANKSKANKLEGAKINQSLLTLGNCIQALSENSDKNSKTPFIPYRGSKLTRLLKDSLGGNCKTVMIANISGSILGYEDTYNTLQYANRAKNIKVNIQKNILQTSNHVSNYAAIIEKLNRENENLRGILNSDKPNGPELNLQQQQHHQRNIHSSNQQQQQQQKPNSPPISLDPQQTLLQESIEQTIKSHFDEEIGHLRTIQEAQMKLDKIFRMNLSLAQEIRKNGPNTESLREQQQINNSGIQGLNTQINEHRNRYKALIEKRTALTAKINHPSTNLPSRILNYLSNYMSMQELTSANLSKEQSWESQKQRIREKQHEINFLQDQLNIRDNILHQQKNLLHLHKIPALNSENITRFSRIKDSQLIMASIQNAIDIQIDVQSTPSQAQQQLYQPRILSPSGRKSIDFEKPPSYTNLTPQRNAKSSLPRLSKNIIQIQDINSLIKPRRSRKSLPNSAKSASALPGVRATPSVSSAAGSNSQSKRAIPLYQYLLNKKQQPPHMMMHHPPQQPMTNRNKRSDYATISHVPSPNSSINHQYTTTIDDSLSESTSLQTNPNTKSISYAKNNDLIGKYQQHVYHKMPRSESSGPMQRFKTVSPVQQRNRTQLSRGSNGSLRAYPQYPPVQQQQQRYGNSQSGSQRSINTMSPLQKQYQAVVTPESQSSSSATAAAAQRRNVFSYDVHSSPYVKSFHQASPESVEQSKKSKLQQLNLNIDYIKDLYTKKVA